MAGTPSLRAHRHVHTLLALARAAWKHGEEGLDPGLILETAGTVLECARVSLWRRGPGPDAWRCERQFLPREGRHVIGSADLPALERALPFDSLGETRVVDRGDALLIAAPLRHSGRTVGVLSCERSVDEPRPFDAEDRAVATSLAELLALAEEAVTRRRGSEAGPAAALHDAVTDLPERGLLIERADRALRVLERRAGSMAVLSVQVQGPAAVRLQAGPEAGDRALAAAARALVGVLRPADTAASLEGDTFGILVDRLDEPWEAIAVAERVLAALDRPRPGGAPGVSIGLAMADGSRPATGLTLLRDAGLARERAAQRGGSRYEVFESALRRDVLERMSLGWALREALPAGQLVVEYQPELRLPERRLLGVEALLRWDRPGHGRILAGSFLDLAERSGLIVPIGAWVLREACKRARDWRRDPRAASLGLRVNLSARQFEEPALVDTVASALTEAGLPPSALCLEITETVLMSDAAASLGTLTALKALGVSLAVDDFGIGYSSLSYLKRFPVDTLKIDRSFVAGLGTDPIDLPIVQAIVSLGRTLGLSVVAEGVERPLQEQTLRALGCERVQGFLYSRALPAEDVPSLFGAP